MSAEIDGIQVAEQGRNGLRSLLSVGGRTAFAACLDVEKAEMKHISMRCFLPVFWATLALVGQSQIVFSQQPMSKGSWTLKNGKPESVNFDYGTKLTIEEIDQLSGFDSIVQIYMGFAGANSEYVTIEGDLLKLGRLKNLEVLYLNKDGIVDDDLKFIARLPKIRELEFNAINGKGGCTDRCADFLSKAKTLRELRIQKGQFTDKFIDKITKGIPNLEQLMLSSPELTDESLRLLADRCKNLKSLSIHSDHFTTEGLKHLDKLPNLKNRGVQSPYFWWKGVAETWLRDAESACDTFEDEDAADLALARLQAVYIEWGEIENAERIARRIKDPFRRVRAHIANARHYAEAGNLEQCKINLDLAKPLAVKSRLSGNALVEAYLELAKSPALTISFMTRGPNDPRDRKKLCQALARHGYLDEALKIAGSEVDDEKQNALRLSIALAAAKTGRIEDTEKVIQDLTTSYAAKQNLWSELPAALYKKGDLDSARRFASRVKSRDIKLKNECLRRIADNLPSDTLSISAYAYTTRLPIPLPSDDPVAANRILEEVIAEAERNPIKSTQGQFGPWNQKFQLARIRVQYSLVAALYRKAGNREQARVKMQLAEEAFQVLAKEERGFGAIIALNELQGPLIHLQDAEGLRRLTEDANVPLLSWAADLVVPNMFMSGDIEAARKLAENTLSGKRVFPLGTVWSQTGDHGLSTGRPSKIVSCFIDAGELDIAFELVKSSKRNSFTAAACENAGRAMVKRDYGLLAKPKWRNGIGAFQRAHLCIGAARMAKEKSNANSRQ